MKLTEAERAAQSELHRDLRMEIERTWRIARRTHGILEWDDYTDATEEYARVFGEAELEAVVYDLGAYD